MTERYSSLTVVFEKDVRSDDAEAIMNAIRQFRGVAGVEGNVTNLAQVTADHRFRNDMAQKVMAIFWPDKGKT